MSRNARVEELSDSDSDPSEMDPSDFDPTPSSSLMNPRSIPSASSDMPALQPHMPGRPPASQAAERERSKHFQCLYPVYFDANRTRAEGRRVGKSQAVANPLAREIVDAVSALGLGGQVVFEPGKMHPKDWANPGRVRVLVKKDGTAVSARVKNKQHLYHLVAEHLKAHPTNEDSPMRLRIAGMPLPDMPTPPPAAPRGWKMGTILPLHSPALSGGGVNEDFMKDMMKELQGQGGMPQLPPGMLGGAGDGGGAPKKKEKKKGKS